MSLRGFIRAFRRTRVEREPTEEQGPREMTLRDAFGPIASDDIVYGSEEHEEIVNHGPRSFFKRRERKWRDRVEGKDG